MATHRVGEHERRFAAVQSEQRRGGGSSTEQSTEAVRAVVLVKKALAAERRRNAWADVVSNRHRMKQVGRECRDAALAGQMIANESDGA